MAKSYLITLTRKDGTEVSEYFISENDYVDGTDEDTTEKNRLIAQAQIGIDNADNGS